MRNIKNFSYNFIKYFAMGLAFTLISFLFRSCEVNAQAFSPTYRGVEIADVNGRATSWHSSVTPTGRSGISFYSFQQNNDSTAYAYRFKITDNFHWNFGKSVVSGYAFCQSHTESGMDLYGCDAVTLVSEVQEKVSCTIEQKEQVTRFVCNSTPNFVVDYVELNMSYPADPYSITGVGAMSIDPDTSQAIVDSNKEIKEGIDRGNQIQQDTNNTIKSDEVDTSTGNSFFNNFSNNGHGLTGVINAPLSFIQSLSNSSCSSVSVTIPFVNEKFNLPCFSSFYKENFNAVYTIYQVVITALVGYWVCVKIYAMVKGFKDPTDDRIEVMDL